MSRIQWLPTTENMVWINLPFRVRAWGLTRHMARKLAIEYRQRNYLARVLRDGRDGWLVAVYRPRRWAPRRCDLAA